MANLPAEEPPPEAGKLPTGRVARTARVGGLVTGQGVRWAGMRAANRVRTPERAAAAERDRTAALVLGPYGVAFFAMTWLFRLPEASLVLKIGNGKWKT